MQEKVFMDFLNNYLLKNNIKDIVIAKDRRSEVFNYRAEVNPIEGEKFYVTLGNYETFLSKLDMVQREMGKQPNECIPVHYKNQSEESFNNIAINLLIGTVCCMFFYQIYKGRNGPGNPPKGPGAKKGGSGAGKPDKKDSGWFGGGGGG
jgi:hypothetical protein